MYGDDRPFAETLREKPMVLGGSSLSSLAWTFSSLRWAGLELFMKVTWQEMKLKVFLVLISFNIDFEFCQPLIRWPDSSKASSLISLLGNGIITGCLDFDLDCSECPRWTDRFLPS